MRTAIILAAGLVAPGGMLALQACASHGTAAPAEVKAVVLDEKARQAAQAVATEEADSNDALRAADDASGREVSAPR